jgi:hypothetical protein
MVKFFPLCNQYVKSNKCHKDLTFKVNTAKNTVGTIYESKNSVSNKYFGNKKSTRA